MNEKLAAFAKVVLPAIAILVLGELVREGKATVETLVAFLAGGGLGLVLPVPGGSKLPGQGT